MIRHLLLAAVLVATPFAAGAQGWTEGRHYVASPNPEAPREDGKISVDEFFWYGCPSCYAFEPHLLNWLETKPADVEFTRYAASLSPAWRLHARAFYTADSLDVIDRVHAALFHAIHEERNALGTPEAIAEVFADEAGVDAEAFQRAFDSFGVETRLRRGDQLARRHQLQGVPTVIVNGKWITGPTMAQGYERLAALIDHLVELERTAAPAGSAASDESAAQDEPAAQDATATAADATAQPAEALETADEPQAGSVTALWWVWLLALVAVAAVVVVAVRRRKD